MLVIICLLLFTKRSDVNATKNITIQVERKGEGMRWDPRELRPPLSRTLSTDANRDNRIKLVLQLFPQWESLLF